MKDKDGNEIQLGDWVQCRDNYGFGKIIEITHNRLSDNQTNFKIKLFNSKNQHLTELNFYNTSLIKLSEDETIILMLES